jgi:hypothetical protein
LVKLFKAERSSDEIIKLVTILDKDPKWYAASSSWSFLEVARALRNDRKTRELVEVDLRELRSHKISFLPVTDRIISEAESLVASTNTYPPMLSMSAHTGTLPNVCISTDSYAMTYTTNGSGARSR